ncbi:MAG: site-specific integrase [Planctomycetaceae bacterium]|nr:site-specific integrase [Planctomycetaceae bacterium]
MRSPKAPSYRLHMGTGQAFVQHRGKRFYLGVHGSERSHEKYRQFVAELMARPNIAPVVELVVPQVSVTIVELTAAYREWAKTYYRKNGEPTGHLQRVWAATAALAKLYGRLSAQEFGPLKLQAMQQSLIASGLSRTYINSLVGDIRRLFPWASANELLPVAVYQSLTTVNGLKQGRSAAVETAPVGPVDDAVVEATLPHLSPVVADMIRLQRLTGMRPCEVCLLRPIDIDRTGQVWAYCPSRHKTEHRGKERRVPLGPKAHALLAPYMLREAGAFCFSPIDSERQRAEARRQSRQTPLTPSQRARRGKSNRKRPPCERYDVASYRRAIARAVARANRARAEATPKLDPLPEWHPNQLRHSAATAIRRQFGLEAAQVTLGHSSADITQIYAERNYGLAEEVASKIG